MVTETEKKEFALSQIAPYLKDPSTCGFNKSERTCEYLDLNGNMCVAGKNMIKPKIGLYRNIDGLLSDNDDEQDGIFKPEVVGILTNQEWKHLQSIHDIIAVTPDNVSGLKERIERLNLFTYEEVVERANSLE